MGYPAQQYPQQQYGPPQGYAQPVYGQPPAPAGPPQFLTPTAGGNAGPLPRHLLGRTVICVPRSYDPNAKFQDQPRPSMTLDVIVLDGGPIEYGDNQDRDASKRTPNTHRCDTPARFNGVMWNSGAIIDKVRLGLSNLGQPPQPTLGVIEQGTQGNRPFFIVDPNKFVDGSDRPDGAERTRLAEQIYTTIESGRFVNPVPVVIWTAPAAAAPQGQPAPQYAQPGMRPDQAGYGQPWQPQSPWNQPAPQATTGTAPYYPAAGNPGAYQQYAAGQPGQLDQAPPNIDPAVWASWPMEQRAAVLAQMAGTPAHPGQQMAPPGV